MIHVAEIRLAYNFWEKSADKCNGLYDIRGKNFLFGVAMIVKFGSKCFTKTL